jgi:hypothetical protein
MDFVFPYTSSWQLRAKSGIQPARPVGGYMANDEIDLLRSVFALAHETRPPLSRKIAEAIRDLFQPRKRIIETLGLVERNKDRA